jgi:hypothetical protein
MNGVQIGWPLAALTATAEMLAIETAFGAKYVVLRTELVRIHRSWGFVWPILRIEHRAKSAPRELAFLAWNRRRLVRELRSLGYDIH